MFAISVAQVVAFTAAAAAAAAVVFTGYVSASVVLIIMNSGEECGSGSERVRSSEGG